jgi:hypothetical protein
MARTNIEKEPEEALKKLEQEAKDIEARKTKILEMTIFRRFACVCILVLIQAQ